MKPLILHIEQIKDKIYSHDFEENAQAFPIIAEMMKNRECEFLEPLKIGVKAYRIRELYEVDGHFQTQIRIGCSRCLKNIDAPLSSEFALTYTREVPGLMDVLNEEEIELRIEEIGLLYFRGEEINLQQGIQEQIVMALPLQPLCDENCKGLCPQCGSNLNQKNCGCEHKSSNNKFAVLKNLKLDRP